MSFAEKLTAIMQRPGQDPVAKDDVPWWMKYAGRGLGCVGGFVAIALGVMNCASIVLGQVDCLIGGLWQMVAGFLVILVEAPCCCFFIDFVQNMAEFADRRPYWNRGALYVIIALPAIFLCPSLSSIFGSGLIFTTGVIYGLMALGKKASQEEMRTNATVATASPDGQPAGLKSTLVDGAQPMGLSVPPAFDSGV